MWVDICHQLVLTTKGFVIGINCTTVFPFFIYFSSNLEQIYAHSQTQFGRWMDGKHELSHIMR
jgi:hypothetical protein